jgi:two-component system, cell cycle response regulator DivK
MSGDGGIAPARQATVVAVVSDLILRQRMVEGLAAAGFAPRVASGPTRLREALADGAPTAILIDLETTALDAVATIRALRADPATAAVPLLGFFGHVNTAVRDAALAAGCDRVATRGEMAMRLDRLMERLLTSRATA